MSPRTPTLPPTEPAMWRKLLGRAHPDTGGSHELFVWTGALREMICDGDIRIGPKPEPSDNPSRRREGSTQRPTPGNDDKPRIPYPAGADFEEVTRRALRTEGPYASVLSLLSNCFPLPHLAHEEARGASYKRLAAIGHAHGMTGLQRSGWYRCAESIPLSDRHAGHILSKLKGTS
jgi:hypothetical protein